MSGAGARVRVFEGAMQELTEECHWRSGVRRNQASAPAIDLDRLSFPHKDSVEIDGKVLSFQYVEAVQRFVFTAKCSDGKEVIVKFAKRYGKNVHEYCTRAGFAPALLFCEPLAGGWVAVVMEYLVLSMAVANTASVRKQLLGIKSTLKTVSFVHGDLRENNVMWDSSNKRVVLIDFDWSGRDGVGKYPPFMNPDIVWPPEAETGKPLRIAHDAY